MEFAYKLVGKIVNKQLQRICHLHFMKCKMQKEIIIGRLNLEVLNENRNLSRNSSSKCDVMKREREHRVFQAENRYEDPPGCSVSEMVV